MSNISVGPNIAGQLLTAWLINAHPLGSLRYKSAHAYGPTPSKHSNTTRHFIKPVKASTSAAPEVIDMTGCIRDKNTRYPTSILREVRKTHR